MIVVSTRQDRHFSLRGRTERRSIVASRQSLLSIGDRQDRVAILSGVEGVTALFSEVVWRPGVRKTVPRC